MKPSYSSKDYEEFSAYLDGQLSPAEKARLDEKLNADPERRAALEEIASTRALLRNAPRYRAPRNFTISAESAQKYARRPFFGPIFAFRFSAALAALSLVAALAIQLGGTAMPAVQNLASAPASAPLASEKPAAPAATSVAGLAGQATATLSIQWDNTSPQTSGKGGGGGTTGANPPATFLGGVGGGGGGGGGGAAESNPPAMSGSVALPPNAVGSTSDNSARSAAAPTQAPAAQPAATLEGSGPILGVPQKGDTGKIISSSGEVQENAGTPQTHALTRQPSPLTQRQVIEYSLVGVGVIAALAALLLRRKNAG